MLGRSQPRSYGVAPGCSHRTAARRAALARADAGSLARCAVPGGGSASAATCGPAASAGPYPPADWTTYCWLDFSSYSDALARAAGGQTFTFTLQDGATVSFVATVNSTATTALTPVAAPSWSGAAMGQSAFIGIPGKPVLYTATDGSTVTVTLSAITVTPPPGVTGGASYMFVAADGESTNKAGSRWRGQPTAATGCSSTR